MKGLHASHDFKNSWVTDSDLVKVRKQDSLTMLASTLGLERLDLRHRLLAFGVRFEEVDPVRIEALVSLVMAPGLIQVVEAEGQCLPNEEKALTDQKIAYESGRLDSPPQQEAHLQFCESLCMRDHALLPHGWTFRYLWDHGQRFIDSFATQEERHCLVLLSQFASRKARFTSLCGFAFGGALALLLLGVQLLVSSG